MNPTPPNIERESPAWTLRDDLRQELVSIWGKRNTSFHTIEEMIAAIDTYVEQAFKRGQQVGQYQAADKMYGDVCHIYMFGDNNTSAKAKSISEWSAVGLLKDCEAFMNDNRKVYAEYIKTLETLHPKDKEASDEVAH